MSLHPRIATTLSILVGFVLAGAVFYGFLVTSWAVSSSTIGSFTFTTPVALQPTNELQFQGSDSLAYVGVKDVYIESTEPLVSSRVLTGIATALPFLIVITACVGAFVLLRRLTKQRPFSGTLQWLLGSLAVLTAVSAAVIPWFHSLSSTLAIRALDLPSDGAQAPSGEPWFAEQHFSFMQDLDWPLFALGAVLLLITLLWPHAVRMQRETEGLV